jgi:hypothetical protein
MKPVSRLAAVLLSFVFALPALAQTAASPSSAASAIPPATVESAAKVETFAGRITRLDTRAGTFSVTAGGKTVDLRAGENVNVNHMRKGGRYIVTYSGDVALGIRATRKVP